MSSMAAPEASWKPPQALPRARHLATDGEQRAAIGRGGGQSGGHVEHSRPADPEAHAEAARRPAVPVGHVGRAALERSHDRAQPVGAGHRQHEAVVEDTRGP